MLKIGITGGIGSGKSTVAAIFEVLGIPVYYADVAAKRLMNTDDALKSRIKQVFGEATYPNGLLDSKYLAGQVFRNENKLTELNSIVHPATIQDAGDWLSRQSAPYAIKEAALIFESGAQQMLDQVIGVYAPTPLRILRVMKRDGISREEVLARMNQQVDEEIKMRLCDFVITNDEQQLVIPQVLTLHEKLLEAAKKSL
jgi:dephospho-CoA kinase